MIYSNHIYTTMPYSLHINKLRLPAHIGVEPKERERIQLIETNVVVTFHKTPTACNTDKLTDTILLY